MRAARTAVEFLVPSLVVLALFLALWPVVSAPYAKLFRAAGNCLVGHGSHGHVWFSAPDDADGTHDTQFVVVNRESRKGAKVSLSSRGHAYLPTAFVVALALASPIPWRIRFRAAFWSVVWVQTYIASKLVLLPFAYDVTDTAGAAWFTLFVHTALKRFFWIVGSASAGWMVAPLIIWALVTFGRFNCWRVLSDMDQPIAAQRRHPASP